MTIQEKMHKYNYIKFISTPKNVHSSYIEGKPYKIESYSTESFMVADETGHEYRIYGYKEKKRFIFVTDKYAEKHLASQG